MTTDLSNEDISILVDGLPYTDRSFISAILKDGELNATGRSPNVYMRWHHSGYVDISNSGSKKVFRLSRNKRNRLIDSLVDLRREWESTTPPFIKSLGSGRCNILNNNFYGYADAVRIKTILDRKNGKKSLEAIDHLRAPINEYPDQGLISRIDSGLLPIRIDKNDLKFLKRNALETLYGSRYRNTFNNRWFYTYGSSVAHWQPSHHYIRRPRIYTLTERLGIPVLIVSRRAWDGIERILFPILNNLNDFIDNCTAIDEARKAFPLQEESRKDERVLRKKTAAQGRGHNSVAAHTESHIERRFLHLSKTFPPDVARKQAVIEYCQSVVHSGSSAAGTKKLELEFGLSSGTVQRLSKYIESGELPIESFLSKEAHQKDLLILRSILNKPRGLSYLDT